MQYADVIYEWPYWMKSSVQCPHTPAPGNNTQYRIFCENYSGYSVEISGTVCSIHCRPEPSHPLIPGLEANKSTCSTRSSSPPSSLSWSWWPWSGQMMSNVELKDARQDGASALPPRWLSKPKPHIKPMYIGRWVWYEYQFLVRPWTNGYIFS